MGLYEAIEVAESTVEWADTSTSGSEDLSRKRKAALETAKLEKDWEYPIEEKGLKKLPSTKEMEKKIRMRKYHANYMREWKKCKEAKEPAAPEGSSSEGGAAEEDAEEERTYHRVPCSAEKTGWILYRNGRSSILFRHLPAAASESHPSLSLRKMQPAGAGA